MVKIRTLVTCEQCDMKFSIFVGSDLPVKIIINFFFGRKIPTFFKTIPVFDFDVIFKFTPKSDNKVIHFYQVFYCFVKQEKAFLPFITFWFISTDVILACGVSDYTFFHFDPPKDLRTLINR